jgi:hypothetical protein
MIKLKRKASTYSIAACVGILSASVLSLFIMSRTAPAQFGNLQKQTSSLLSKMPDFQEMHLTALSIFISAIGGIRAYKANEAWKHRQYIEEKIKDFEASASTINVRKMISAELHCVELFPFVENSMERFAIVEDCEWTEALLECKCNHTLKEQYHRINRKQPLYEQPSAVKSCIRDNFNMFMLHLQHFEKMIEANALDQETLRSYLYPWFESLRKTETLTQTLCPVTKKTYTPQKALLEYMGLLEGVPEAELSIIQKDVRALVTRYRCLGSFLDADNSHPLPESARICPVPELV